MKKIIALTLAVLMTCAFGVPAFAAWSTGDTVEVAESDGMTYEQLNPDSTARYDWSDAVSLDGTVTGSFEGTHKIEVTHAGDYLYVRTTMTLVYSYRTRAEQLVYVDLTTGDGEIDYIVVVKPNYSPYEIDGVSARNYSDSVTDKSGQNCDWGVEYNYSVNKGSALEKDVLFGRNSASVSSSSTTADVVIHMAIPLDDTTKTALANGSADIGFGFAFLQKRTASAARLWTNCGDFAQTFESGYLDMEPFYDNMTEEKLTTLTLKKGDNTERPDGTISTANANGVTPAEKLANITEYLNDDKSRFYDKSLEGLTVNILGDSYFGGDSMGKTYVWPALMAIKYGWTLNNYGVNGGLVAQVSGQSTDPMVTRYKDMVDNDADLIIVDGGRNDYNNEVPIGTLNSSDTSTFMGALNTIIDGLKAKYPNAEIIFTTVWKYSGSKNGLTYLDYAEAMVNVCENKGVYCFRAYDPSVSGVDMTNADFRAEYCLTSTDVSHLNVKGMKLVMPKFEQYIYECMNGLADSGDDESDGLKLNDFSNTLVPSVSMNDIIGSTTDDPNTGDGNGDDGNTGNTDGSDNTDKTDKTDETQADETEAQSTPMGSETDAETEEEKGGCGSTVSVASFGIIALLGAGITVLRKKK